MGRTKTARQRRAEAWAESERQAAERSRAEYAARHAAEKAARELAELPRRVRDLRRALELCDTLDAVACELGFLTEHPLPLDGITLDVPDSVPVHALAPSTLAATLLEELAAAERRLLACHAPVTTT